MFKLSLYFLALCFYSSGEFNNSMKPKSRVILCFFIILFTFMTWIVTDAQKLEIEGVLTDVYGGIIDFLYTIIMILVNFFTKPEVLGALAVISIIYTAYAMLRNKRLR